MSHNTQFAVASHPPHAVASIATPIRVLLADDHAVVLWGLRQLVESTSPRMIVSGTASNSRELLTHPALEATDVVVLDLGLGDANALDCLPRLLSGRDVKVVVLTGETNPRHHRDAVLRGARGVVLKSQPPQSLLDAVERVHAGEVSFDGALMSMLLDALPGKTPSSRTPPRDTDARRIATLTPKERQVVEAVVTHRGAKSLAVAEVLGMSEHTLRNHLTVVYGKLQVRGKLDLYVYATEQGIVPAARNPSEADASKGPGRRPGATAARD
jgi:DNA-binding NarL/FixJ family response regulator